jgi:4-hydroxybenzoyl-CoA thioesterase
VPFEFATPVRFADVDHAGIVYYPRFFHYFHMAFEELFRVRHGAAGVRRAARRDRVGFPAVHAEADYKAPLRFGDTAEVAVSVARLGATSITFRYRVRRDEVECAVGTVVCAVVDLDAFAARPVPPAIRDLVADLVES